MNRCEYEEGEVISETMDLDRPSYISREISEREGEKNGIPIVLCSNIIEILFVVSIDGWINLEKFCVFTLFEREREKKCFGFLIIESGGYSSKNLPSSSSEKQNNSIS